MPSSCASRRSLALQDRACGETCLQQVLIGAMQSPCLAALLASGGQLDEVLRDFGQVGSLLAAHAAGVGRMCAHRHIRRSTREPIRGTTVQGRSALLIGAVILPSVVPVRFVAEQDLLPFAAGACVP